jgi:hypothetical protein
MELNTEGFSSENRRYMSGQGTYRLSEIGRRGSFSEFHLGYPVAELSYPWTVFFNPGAFARKAATDPNVTNASCYPPGATKGLICVDGLVA